MSRCNDLSSRAKPAAGAVEGSAFVFGLLFRLEEKNYLHLIAAEILVGEIFERAADLVHGGAFGNCVSDF